MVNRKLIFDLGFHNEDDSDFYLKKGFNVVAVEANPVLVRKGLRRFRSYVAQHKLILINKAVSLKKGKIDFFIHPIKSDWSSCNKRLVEIDGYKSKRISIESVSFSELCAQFGTPWYAKVDVEGQDVAAAEDLYTLECKPCYISFELSKQTYAEIFSWLYLSGYKKFQLVNQLNHPNRNEEINQAQTEGKNIKYKFTRYSSGFFGKDLPKYAWLSFNEALSRYLKYRELKIIDNKELALGWLDVHANL